MKTYSKEERIEAKNNLPRPVSGFLSSNTITEIYDGLIKKHHLNLWQGSLVSKTANLILLGLEPQSSIETNLHQVLPELSSATTREIVNDLNDRIFKEASRRLHENIIEPEPEWDVDEFGPKPTKDGAGSELPTDEELDKLAEKEAVEGWEDPEEEAERKAEIERAQSKPLSMTLEETANTSTSSIVAEKLGLVTDTSIENKKTELSIATPETQEEKIGEVPANSIPNETQTPVPVKPQASEAQKPAYKGGVDPYREPVE